MIRNPLKSPLPKLALAFGFALTGVASTSALAADAGDADLREQVRQLQQELHELKAQRTATAPAAPQDTTAQANRAVEDAIKDAQRQDRFLAVDGFTAGYRDNGFWIQSADGNFTFNPNLFTQFRYIADWRHGSKNGGADDLQSGFEFRRLKVSFDGTAGSPDLVYKVQFNTTSRTTASPLADEVYVKYHFAGTPWSIKAGQFSNNWDHETENSSKKLMAVERSVLQNVFGSGGINSENYVQGVEVSYDGGNWYGWVNYNDGINSRNTIFSDGGGGSALLGLTVPTGAFSGRAVYKITGDWKDYEDFSAMKTKKDLVAVGAGFDYEMADNVNVLLHTVDFQYESAAIKGLSFFASYYGAYRDFRTVAAGVDSNTYEWGALAQVGYLINDQWEPFIRYDFVHLDNNAPAGNGSLGSAARITDTIHEFTIGTNYYLRGHRAKFTFDATYLPNGCPIDLNGAGILAQPNDKAQFLVRAQFQLLL